eukprot:718402-Pelagomonas_calceolata.AAC.5
MAWPAPLSSLFDTRLARGPSLFCSRLQQIAVGVGTMAGSSVILLTTCWGAAVLAGRTELSLDVGCAAATKTLCGETACTGQLPVQRARPERIC